MKSQIKFQTIQAAGSPSRCPLLKSPWSCATHSLLPLIVRHLCENICLFVFFESRWHTHEWCHVVYGRRGAASDVFTPSRSEPQSFRLRNVAVGFHSCQTLRKRAALLGSTQCVSAKCHQPAAAGVTAWKLFKRGIKATWIRRRGGWKKIISHLLFDFAAWLTQALCPQLPGSEC